MNSSRKQQLCLGIVLILLLLVVIWTRSRESGDSSSKTGREASSWSSRPDNQNPNARKRSRSSRRTSMRVTNPTHAVKDLVDFYHPAIRLGDASLDEAMARLLALYREICEETGETMLPLDWEIAGSPSPLGPIRLEGPFLNSCRKLALLSRMDLKIEGGTFVFQDLEPGPEVEKSWVVPPTFKTYLNALFENKTLETNDPFAPIDKAQRISGIRELLHERGILQPGEILEYDPGSGKVTVKGEGSTINLIENLVTTSLEERPLQIRYTAQQEVDGEWKALPTVVALPGQRATLELGDEVPYLAGNGTYHTAWLGTRLRLQAELYGFGERSEVHYSHTAKPSKERLLAFSRTGEIEAMRLEPRELNVDSLVTTVSDRRMETMYQISAVDDGGVQIRLFGERIDAAGRRIPGPIERREETAIRPVIVGSQ